MDISTLTPAQLTAILEQNAALVAQNAQLAAEAAAAKASQGKQIYLKVSEKKAASLYGLGRMPVTLYKGQWERLFDNTDLIKQFLNDNVSELSDKPNAKAAAVAAAKEAAAAQPVAA